MVRLLCSNCPSGLYICNTVRGKLNTLLLRYWWQSAVSCHSPSEWNPSRFPHLILPGSSPPQEKYHFSRRYLEAQITNLSLVSHVLLGNARAHGYFLSSLFPPPPIIPNGNIASCLPLPSPPVYLKPSFRDFFLKLNSCLS